MAQRSPGPAHRTVTDLSVRPSCLVSPVAVRANGNTHENAEKGARRGRWTFWRQELRRQSCVSIVASQAATVALHYKASKPEQQTTCAAEETSMRWRGMGWRPAEEGSSSGTSSTQITCAGGSRRCRRRAQPPYWGSRTPTQRTHGRGMARRAASEWSSSGPTPLALAPAEATTSGERWSAMEAERCLSPALAPNRGCGDVVATRMDVRWCGDSMHRSCPARHLAKQVAGGVLAGLGPGQAQWGSVSLRPRKEGGGKLGRPREGGQQDLGLAGLNKEKVHPRSLNLSTKYKIVRKTN
uniref:Uncharacterized protein n=1 Tax=Oryza rufipogon TaxID=4529 RepID=A0A0E0MYE0_ORYRU